MNAPENIHTRHCIGLALGKPEVKAAHFSVAFDLA